MSESARSVRPAEGLRQTLPRRLRAVGVHLGISLVVLAFVFYLIRVRWFPGFHFGIDGGWQGLRLTLAVQLVLGPLLTLVIFNPFKARRLIVFDLACIGLAQACALGFGLYAVHGQRPVSINFYDGVFYSMPATSMRAEPEVAAMLDAASPRRPGLVYVALPANEPERRRAAGRAGTRRAAQEDAFFFRAFAPHWAAVQEHRLDPAGTQDAPFARDLPAFLGRYRGTAADYRFFRYQAGYGSCVLALSAIGEVVDALGCERA